MSLKHFCWINAWMVWLLQKPSTTSPPSIWHLVLETGQSCSVCPRLPGQTPLWRAWSCTSRARQVGVRQSERQAGSLYTSPSLSQSRSQKVPPAGIPHWGSFLRMNFSGWLWRRVGLGADLTRLLKWSTRSLALTTAVKAVAGQVSIRGIFQAGIRNRIKLDIRKVPDLQ